MFLGTYILTFTGKGRVILPKKLRNQLEKSEVILMKGLDGGIWGFSDKEWVNFSKHQLESSLTEKQGRELRRQFFPFAEVSELDGQGRFVLPEFLIKLAKIKTKMVMIGVGDHFEIWDYSIWHNMVNKGEDNE